MRTVSFHTLAVTLALLLLALPGLKIFANDGDTFVGESPEGIKLNYKVICEQDKTAEATGMAEDKPISDYGQLTIPAEANGYSVISIGERAFKNNNYINKVIISEGVQFIRAGAFLFCSRLNTVILPSTIRELQDYSLQSWVKNVVMLSQEPVTCGYHVFDEAIEELFESYTGEIIIDQNTTWHLGTFRQAVLFVPKGSKNKYAEAGTWSLFQEIVEIDGLSQDFIVPPSYEYQQNAFNLFDRLRATKKKTDNICFSPLSAQLALSMLQNGADGNTLKEMKWAMGLSEYSDGEINLFNQALTQSLTSRPEFLPEQWKWYGATEEEARKYYDAEYPVCEIANSIWHRPDITLLDSFTDTARSYYDAGIGSVRFDTQEGIDQINQWVSDKTHTLIPKIYNEPQSAELAVVLANALYFKGAWHTPFDKENTRPGVFHNANGSNVMTDMMTVRAEYQSTTTDKFQTVTLPYGNGDFSMTIFLPVEGTKLPDLTRADWIQTVSQPQQFRPYTLTFPRFDFGNRHEMNDVLKKIGMMEAFDKDKAEFTRMTDCQTFISKVLQLSKISVDEEGTEAAAVTIIGIEGTSIEDPDPVNYEPFRIDRPFYFTIENRKEKAVLFVGRVATLEGEPFTAQPADVNQDNTVDISDIVAVINVIAGTDTNSKADVNADGKTDISDIVAVINSIAKVEKDPTVKAGLCPDSRHPHAIDMGNGVKVACCNLGADAPWEYGDYYAWGETEPKESYRWEDYVHSEEPTSCSGLGDDIAGTCFDAAYTLWGKPWRTPSTAQAWLLKDNCQFRQARINNVTGTLCTAPNGNSIFLPAGGEKEQELNRDGAYGYYWLSNPLTEKTVQDNKLNSGMEKNTSFCFIFDTYYTYISYLKRWNGANIRPIME